MSAELVSILAQIMACQAQVLGMQADNMQREACGESMAWVFDDFAVTEAELSRLAASARLLA